MERGKESEYRDFRERERVRDALIAAIHLLFQQNSIKKYLPLND